MIIFCCVLGPRHMLSKNGKVYNVKEGFRRIRCGLAELQAMQLHGWNSRHASVLARAHGQSANCLQAARVTYAVTVTGGLPSELCHGMRA
jgi:hypothetical protein